MAHDIWVLLRIQISEKGKISRSDAGAQN